ncbi:UPF0301 protein SPO0296-like, partial [Ylistrum balloti]|uniref:UPF0301 protein SPO0296-like n=1 Tax=Ylistrum balloti TaxID=509963 RepID=UPI002905F290
MQDQETETRLAPSFLVSVPQLQDPHFERAVVYLITHGEEGAFGLTINRPGQLTLPEVCSEFGFTSTSDAGVFQGGPVDPNRGFLLHSGGDALEGSETIETGIHISGLPETLKQVCNGQIQFRLFLGYSGWAPGQLDQELGQGAWLTVPSDPQHIFETSPDNVWDQVLRGVGIDPGMIMASQT